MKSNLNAYLHHRPTGLLWVRVVIGIAIGLAWLVIIVAQFTMKEANAESPESPESTEQAVNERLSAHDWPTALKPNEFGLNVNAIESPTAELRWFHVLPHGDVIIASH